MGVGGGRLVLTDTSKVMDKKERKDFGIKTMMEDVTAIKNM